MLFTLLISAILHLSNCDPTVLTENGPIRGKTLASGKVEAFLGVPYAEPPLGSLRFAKPIPKTSWTDVYDATQKPPPCVQLDMGLKGGLFPDLTNMSEDCLYLNVWVPKLKREDDELKTVMFFIHGGSFLFMSSSMDIYDGANLAEIGDVVVVTINYRLGALGFFAGFTEDAPGNQGLQDQVMALRWIKDNAKHFHGDPDNIVIFGESAGAYSVSFHLISPLSRNLFNRAILQSGSAVIPIYNTENKGAIAVKDVYLRETGCTDEHKTWNNNRKDVLDCLRKIPTKKIADFEMAFKQLYVYTRTGDDFLPEGSIEMFRKGLFKNSDVLMGVTKDEGALFVSGQNFETLGFFGEKNIEDIFNETTAYNFIKNNLMFCSDDPVELHKTIQSYLDDVDEKGDYTYLKAASHAVGDIIINCGVIFQAEYHSMKDINPYFYMFNHRTSAAPYGKWMGVPHFEEVQYVFGNPLFQNFTEEEKELSRDIIMMWTNFAKTGNPNNPGGVQWPRFTYKDPKYYIIGGKNKVATRPDNYRCERWRNIFRSPIDEAVIESLKKHKEL